MPSEIRGIKTQSIPQVEERGNFSETGVGTITRNEVIPAAVFPALLKPIGSAHPRFTGMYLESCTWTRVVKRYHVEYTYRGYLSGSASETPVYTLEGTLSEDPIQLHPDFVSNIAGKPSAPLNGALFVDPETEQETTDDSIGVFREFKAITSGTQNKKAGVSSYLVPGLRWVKRWTARAAPTDFTKLGEIDTPEGPAPSVSPRNWLFYSLTYTKKGGLYDIEKTWLMSAKGGWDQEIYQS